MHLHEHEFHRQLHFYFPLQAPRALQAGGESPPAPGGMETPPAPPPGGMETPTPGGMETPPAPPPGGSKRKTSSSVPRFFTEAFLFSPVPSSSTVAAGLFLLLFFPLSLCAHCAAFAAAANPQLDGPIGLRLFQEFFLIGLRFHQESLRLFISLSLTPPPSSPQPHPQPFFLYVCLSPPPQPR